MTDSGTPRRRRARAEPAPTTPDPIEIAMEAEASGEAPVGEAAGLLADQRRLIGWQIAGARAAFGLRLLTGLAGVAVAMGLGLMAWNAAHDESMVVQPFSAPLSWAARGLDGASLAGRYSDEIVQLQRQAAKGYVTVQALRGTNDDIRLEIPQTGVSLGDIQRVLTGWLGHQTVVSGALSEDGSGVVTLTVRIAGQGAFSANGPPGDLDAMIRQLAERTFVATDAPRATLAFLNMNRFDDLLRVTSDRVASLDAGSPELPLALVFRTMAEPDSHRSVRFLRQATAADPTLINAWFRLAIFETQLGWEQSAYDDATRGLATRDSDQLPSYSPDGLRRIRRDIERYAAPLTGDFAAVVAQTRQPPAIRGSMAAQGRDTATARRIVADAQLTGRIRPDTAARTRVRIAQAVQDWPAMAAALEDYQAARAAWLAQPPGPGLPPRAQTGYFQVSEAETQARLIDPLRAIALARTGRIDDARALAATTPLDCAPCLRARAEVETAARNGPAADAWYAKALALGPRLPLAEAEWAASRLELRDPVGAAAKAAAAAAKGPRYADPLAYWGEALLAQGDAKGAATKFTQAAKLAPRWGRLHLKWGEALAKLGKGDEAQAQFRIAAGLDLTPAERAELVAVAAKRNT